jgi:membrane peptidoglycan carboxypeptidase
MGYDDNTPLTGVTGGGLPAEIWQETMVRVHEGIDPKPLPMIRPQPKPQVQQQPEREPLRRQQRRTQPDRGNPIENILRGILGMD